MISIEPLDGQHVDIDGDAIVLIAGPYPHDVGPRTYISGATPAPLVTAEPPQALMNRLGVEPPLAQFTRPDSTPVWVKGAAVTALRAPLPGEIQGPGEVKTVLILGRLHQSVQEDEPAARIIIDAHGGHL
jgi:hypothetical protein